MHCAILTTFVGNQGQGLLLLEMMFVIITATILEIHI